MNVRRRGALALLVLVALVCGFAPHAFAEGLTKVKGKVVDKDGKPIAKAAIWFEATDIKKTAGPVHTNKDGEYLIATLDRTVAKKWRVVPKIDGYKAVKVSWEVVDSSGSLLDQNESIMGTKQELPDFPFVLVGDEGRNVVNFIMAKDADFVAAVQAEQKKKAGGATGTTTAGAAAGAAGAAGAPGAPAGAPAPPAAPAIAPEAAQSLQKAKDLAAAGNHAEAISLYQAYLAKDPTGLPSVYYYLGKSLFETGDDQASAQAFSKGLELKKDMKGAHFFLGNIAVRGDDAVTAAAEYEKELLLSPDAEAVLYNLGQAYDKAGNQDKAIAALDRAATVNPSKPEYLMALAGIYEQRKDKAKADEMYQKVAAIDPHNAAILFFNVGVKAWNENKPKEAVQAYTKAIEIDANYAQAHRELGRVLMASQDFPGALKHFQEYLKLEPKAPDAKEIQDSIALLKK
jgi:tetratricopeptide (TPR) repeat protein